MLTLSVFVVLMASASVTSQTTVKDVDQKLVEELEARLTQLHDRMAKLSRYTMMQQFSAEERIRMEGDSGVNIIREDRTGMYNYYTTGHVGNSMVAIHDHSDTDRTIGQGELVAVMNGVSFSTQHNDYRLVMASTNSTDYHAVEDIPFPEVPKEVTDKLTVPDQITEMKQWFKAFSDQDYSVRDYRKYFKPVLCYLEGTWTLTDSFDQRFEPEANSWEELTNKVRYSAYTGTKFQSEKLAHLPTTMMSMNSTTGEPQYARWNYRTLCSPLKEDVALGDLRPVDELSYRVATGNSRVFISNDRRGRFVFFEKGVKSWSPIYTKFDRLFHTVPGMNNGPADLNQGSSHGNKVFSVANETDVLLNTGFYHRMFKAEKRGAMGLRRTFRGFNDPTLWVAETTQEEVAPMPLTSCKKVRVRIPNHRHRHVVKVCETEYSRFSYAFPLEILYMTPLLSWNPYNISVHEEGGVDPAAGARSGSLSNKAEAYDGVNNKHYYLTPAQFFSGTSDPADPMDSGTGSVGVLDQSGDLKVTAGSGTRVILPDIQGVGKVRLRYPIAPIHGEGNTAYKELNALKTKLWRENGLNYQ
ncbi:uncharacterized protein LOC101845468 [Aplysia californica]|uniref:Uncharacterized protein LOC101845468 n=1 Tax=Aplysia californica TaxID=6500 RepID=A0ABM1A0I6_APLCA|nr:uncharacterized protein LOC101845468 [Aplysia californica]